MKDPAFLLYFKNFISDARFWDNETRGALVSIWCEQAAYGHLDWDNVKFICRERWETIWKTIKHRFEEDDFGKWYDTEIEEILKDREKAKNERISHFKGKRRKKSHMEIHKDVPGENPYLDQIPLNQIPSVSKGEVKLPF